MSLPLGRHLQNHGRLSKLTEQSDDLEISDRYASGLSVEFVALTQKLLEEKTDTKERWECLREVFRELTQLRRDDHRAVRTVIKRDRWNREVEREDEEALKREEKEHKSQLIDMCFNPMQERIMAEHFGGGEYGEKMAGLITRIQNGRPLSDGLNSPAETHSDPVKPSQIESDPIQPNQTG